MTKDEIISMARESGFSQPWTAPKETQERLTRFAQLVAKHTQEQCAKVCDIHAGNFILDEEFDRADGAAYCADEVRNMTV